MTLEGTPTLVDPAGVANVEFKDEVQTANAQAPILKKQGVKSIVVLLHEGGVNAGTYQQCVGVSDPILTIAKTMTPRGRRRSSPATPTCPYVCHIPDPAGNPRLVTSAASYGQVVTETDLVINTKSGEVDRGRSTATNHLVARTVAKDADPDGDHRQVERPVRRPRRTRRRLQHRGHPRRQQRQPRHRDADG